MLCPKCNSTNVSGTEDNGGKTHFLCYACNHTWIL
jgi:transposase-like protein